MINSETALRIPNDLILNTYRKMANARGMEIPMLIIPQNVRNSEKDVNTKRRIMTANKVKHANLTSLFKAALTS